MVGALVAPVPLELLAFGLDASLRALGDTRLGDEPSSPDNGLLADYSGPISLNLNPQNRHFSMLSSHYVLFCF